MILKTKKYTSDGDEELQDVQSVNKESIAPIKPFEKARPVKIPRSILNTEEWLTDEDIENIFFE